MKKTADGDVSSAIVESRQAQMTEVFLPYVVQEGGQTLFEKFTESAQKQLTTGK